MLCIPRLANLLKPKDGEIGISNIAIFNNSSLIDRNDWESVLLLRPTSESGLRQTLGSGVRPTPL